MGFLGRLLGRSPEDSLKQAEALLARGEASRALGLARKVLSGDTKGLGEQAAGLAARAEEAMLQAALERVDEAEAAELWEEALDYLGVALEQAKAPEQRRELAARGERLEQRLEDELAAQDEPPGPAVEGGEEAVLELESHYWALIDSLKAEVSQLYEDRSEAFQRAYVDLNQGAGPQALEAFEALASENPDDPVLRLERGRCRLLNGDSAGAVGDLEAAWEGLGGEPLDHSETFFVPVLWAEAQLALGEPQAVLTRLSELGSHEVQGNAQLLGVYSQALLAAEEWDEAHDVLQVAAARFPQVGDFSFTLAQLLVRRGQAEEAVAGLDDLIKSCCSGGSCSTKPLHPPSLRLLTGLLLEKGERLDRVEELLALTRQAQSGAQTREDLELSAEYYRQSGDERAATRVARALEKLASSATTSEPSAQPASLAARGDVLGLG